MKINKDFYENCVWEYGRMKGEKLYKLSIILENIGVYSNGWQDIFFELDSLEEIGYVEQSDVRCSRKNYYNASYTFGWDGDKKTRKEAIKKLCTRGDYVTAKDLLLQEYKNH